MSGINKNNYEAYFLDFVEGKLSAGQEDELRRFLEKNPALQKELDDFESIELSDAFAHGERADFSEELLREETTGLLTKDYLMIAQVENTITGEEKEELGKLLQKEPSLLNDLAAYHKTVLKREELIFPNKSQLLRKDRKLIVLWRAVASAAAILLLVFLFQDSPDRKYQSRAFAWTESALSGEPEEHFAFTVQKEGEDVISVGKREPEVINKAKLNRLENNSLAKLDKGKKTPPSPEVEELSKEPLLAEEAELPVKEKSNEEETKPPSIAMEGVEELLAENTAAASREDFVPIKEFARQAIEKEVSKGKTFSESVMEELAQTAKEKIELETEKDEAGKMQSFALNIGKLKISRNR